jgi:predicted acetyltransferase
MVIEVRCIDPSETAVWFTTISTAFQQRWNPELPERVRSLWDYRRVWAAVEDGAFVGTFRSWATALTVPGGTQLPATAVTGVSVLPTHRRRGILRRMTPVELAAARERGEAIAVLWASEYPIYGRFGFGPGTLAALWSVEAGRTRVLGGGRPDAVRYLEPSAVARELVKGIYETWRLRQAGEIRRREFTWDDELGLQEPPSGMRWKGFLALHHGADGTPDGYARYHVEERWELSQPRSVLHVDELHALSDEAYAGLWRFLLSLDWVSEVRTDRRSVHERLPWLLDNARAAQLSDVRDGMWVALLDLPRALASRRYERTGTVVMEAVTDPRGPDERRETVLLDASPDGTTCTLTDRAPDLTVDAGALGAAYLGGVRLRDAVLARGADEHRGGALHALDALLRTDDPPWCSTFF